MGDAGIGIRWKFPLKLEDRDFADDIGLLSSNKHHLPSKINKLAGQASRVGLKINADKCKRLRFNASNNET